MMSLSKKEVLPCMMALMRSRPMPVSRLRCGSSGMEPSSWRSNCVNTRFQYSRKRSQSQPGAQSGRPQPTSSPMS